MNKKEFSLSDCIGWVDKTHIVIEPNPRYHNSVILTDKVKEFIRLLKKKSNVFIIEPQKKALFELIENLAGEKLK